MLVNHLVLYPRLETVLAASVPVQSEGQEAPFATTADETRDVALQIATQIELAAVNVPVPRLKPARPQDNRLTVVLDAGHGGRDPGAVGPAGTLEKTVALLAAKELKTILEARGYKVVMTRETDKHLDRDKSIDLEKRITLAKESDAELFLSIHADGSVDSSVRGASVYTLSDQGEVRLINRVSNDGNFVLGGDRLGDVESDAAYIAVDVAATGMRNEAATLSRLMVNELEDTTLMLRNTHRRAGFAVLLSPDVPSVLLELGFITNPSDEKNLNSKTWRKKTLTAVADSIDTYFDGNPQFALNRVSAGGQ